MFRSWWSESEKVKRHLFLFLPAKVGNGLCGCMLYRNNSESSSLHCFWSWNWDLIFFLKATCKFNMHRLRFVGLNPRLFDKYHGWELGYPFLLPSTGQCSKFCLWGVFPSEQLECYDWPLWGGTCISCRIICKPDISLSLPHSNGCGEFLMRS